LLAFPYDRLWHFGSVVTSDLSLNAHQSGLAPTNLKFMESHLKDSAATQKLVGGLSYARDREFPRIFLFVLHGTNGVSHLLRLASFCLF
jgi:hypothetical protein